MRISHHKPGKPYKRAIHINGKAWSWRIVSDNVWIRSPDGKMTIHTDAFEINETTYDEYFSAYQSDYPSSLDISPCPTVTPSDIKRLIEKQIAEDNDC